MRGAAFGAHIGNAARDHAVHEVKVVDHQVQHGGHVRAAARPRAGAPAFHFQRRFFEIEQAGAREHIALLMAHGENAVLDLGQRDQRIGFLEVRGDRLFDQHVCAGFQEAAHDRRVGDGRRADGNDINLAEQVAPVGDGGDAVGGFGGAARIGRRIGNGGELHARQLGIFRSVMTAERALPDNGGAEQTGFLLWCLKQGESPGKTGV